MWHESRKHDRNVCGIILNRKKKNEEKRLKNLKFAKDPLTFIRVVGTKAKKYVDDGRFLPTFHDLYLVPWESDPSVRIDRFDARAFLDTYSIPESVPYSITKTGDDGFLPQRKVHIDQKLEKLCNYERFKTLVEMKFLNVDESKYVKRIMEDCGETTVKERKHEGVMHNYNEGIVVPSSDKVDFRDKKDDPCVNVDSLTSIQKTLIDKIAEFYGIQSDSFCNFLTREKYQSKYSEMIEREENEIQEASKNNSKRDRKSLKKKQKAIRAISEAPVFADEMCELSPTNSFLNIGHDKRSVLRNSSDTSTTEESSDNDRKNRKRRRRKTEKIEYISEFDTSSLKNRRVYSLKPTKGHIVETTVKPLPAKSRKTDNQKKLTPQEILKRKMLERIENQQKIDREKAAKK